MASNSIMEDIRNLLSQGKSSTEVISLGYKPPTVYKVQRRLRQQQPNGKAPVQVVNQNNFISDREEQEESSFESIECFQSLDEPVDKPAQSSDPLVQLNQAQCRIEELEEEAREAQNLRARLKELEAKAESLGGLKWKFWGLERDLERSSQTQADLRQSNIQWQSKFQAERSARQTAERRAQEYRDQISQWQQEIQVLKSHLDASGREMDILRAALRQLEPLKAWAGHPCSICHKPMSGSVDQELAARMMKDLAHKNCLEKQGSRWGKCFWQVVPSTACRNWARSRQRSSPPTESGFPLCSM